MKKIHEFETQNDRKDFEIFIKAISEGKLRKSPVVVKDEIIYPSEEFIITVHDILIEEFEDAPDKINVGILTEANITFSLWHIYEQVGNEGSKNEKAITKAAHLMNNLVTSHAFVDGNKRTGFVLFLLFLMINNVKFKVDFSDYVAHSEFIRNIASKERDEKNAEKIIQWFKDNSTS